ARGERPRMEGWRGESPCWGHWPRGSSYSEPSQSLQVLHGFDKGAGAETGEELLPDCMHLFCAPFMCAPCNGFRRGAERGRVFFFQRCLRLAAIPKVDQGGR